jgi:hypothetical protein
MIDFPCPSCGARLQMSEDLAGKKVRCSSCKAVVTAPQSGETSEAIQSGASPAAVAAGAPRGQRGSDDDDDRARRRSGSDAAAAAGTAAAAGGLGAGAIIAIVGVLAVCLVCGVVGGLIGLLFPAVAKVREAASRAQATNNLKQISLAIHIHQDTNRQLPTPKATMPDGKNTELSWRVSILPFIEQQALFNQFDRTQAWDSPRNQGPGRLLVPAYQDPGKMDATTPYQYFTGPGTLWPDNSKKILPKDFPAGTSNTFLVAEAANAVPWAKPADMVVQPGQPVPVREGRFLVAMADASVRVVDHNRVTDASLLLYIDPRNAGPHPPID